MRFLFCFLFLFQASLLTSAQSKKKADTLAPYQKNTNLPAFSFRLLDSITIFNTKSILKGKPTVFVLFSPDCDHCAQLAREIKSNVNNFDEVNLFMLSPPMPFDDIRMFAQVQDLVHTKQITIGQDFDFFFGSFFRAETVPFIVIYDKDRKLFNVLKRATKLEELLNELDRLRGNKKP